MKKISWLKIVGFALAVGIAIGVYSVVMAYHGGGDLTSLYIAELRRDAGQPVYWPAPEVNPRLAETCPDGLKAPELNALTGRTAAEILRIPVCFHTNLNPPFVIVLAAGLARMGFQAAWWSWFLASLGCFILTIRLILAERLVLKGVPWSGPALTVGAFLYFPTIISFFSGQITSVIMLPLILGWLKLRRGENAPGGAWLGVAASMKPFLGLFLVGLFVQGNGRAVMAMLAAGLACALVGLLADGLDAYRGYLEALNTVSWHAASWNASFSGLFSRFFGGSQNTPWFDAPRLARGLIATAVFCVLAIYISGMRLTHAWPAKARADFLCASSTPAMLLISPLGWLYYFPLLLPCAVLLWRHCTDMQDTRCFRWALAVSLILSGMPSWMISAREMNSPLDWFGAAGFYPVALLQLFVLTMILVRRGHFSAG